MPKRPPVVQGDVTLIPLALSCAAKAASCLAVTAHGEFALTNRKLGLL